MSVLSLMRVPMRVARSDDDDLGEVFDEHAEHSRKMEGWRRLRELIR
jgi:hypothetical protein